MAVLPNIRVAQKNNPRNINYDDCLSREMPLCLHFTGAVIFFARLDLE